RRRPQDAQVERASTIGCPPGRRRIRTPRKLPMNGAKITGSNCMNAEPPRGAPRWVLLAPTLRFGHSLRMFGRSRAAHRAVPMPMAQATHPVKTGAGTEHERLGALLVSQGHCDTKTLERARSVAAESGQRLDSVLIQLGLVSERGLAEALAALLTLPLVAAEHYPAEPLLTERLTAKFLRQA